MNESHSILQRMRELAVQSANDTNTDSDRIEMQKEVNQLASALTDISEDTEFNTQSLLDGSFEGTFQIGANSGQNLSVEVGDMSAESLGVTGEGFTFSTIADSFEVTNESGEAVSVEFESVSTTGSASLSNGVLTVSVEEGTDTFADVNGYLEGETGLTSTLTEEVTGTDTVDDVSSLSNGTVNVSTEKVGIDVTTQSAADSAVTTIQSAIDSVSAQRSELGAVQNRLDHTINNLGTSAENLTAAESRIRDVDYDIAAA